MTTKLSLYNGALSDHLGERKLITLTENRKARRDLDAVFDDAIKFCLEAASWNSATRELQIVADPDYEPEFGYSGVFDKPEDWVRTQAVSLDEYFSTAFLGYKDQNGFLFADHEILYLQYISNDPAYGGDMTLWPQSFVSYVEAYLAWKVCLTITGDKALKATIKADMDKARAHAQSVDNQNEPTKFSPRGTWANSRTRYRIPNSRERAP